MKSEPNTQLGMASVAGRCVFWGTNTRGGVLEFTVMPELGATCQQFADDQKVPVEAVLQGGLRALGLRYQGLLGEATSWTFRMLLAADEAEKTEFNLEPDMASRADAHYCALLGALIANPDKPISEPCFLSQSEKDRQVAAWNDTRTDYPRNACIVELFEEIVREHADRIAIVDGEEQFTYAALNERAELLAEYLEQRGVKSNDRVGLALERSIGMVVAMLGILKTGAAYVPLDTEYPAERLRFMVDDTELSAIVTDPDHAPKLPSGAPIVVMEDAERATGRRDHAKATAESTAYIMYTSGSTGVPKGVEVTQRGVIRLVRNATYVNFGPGEVFAQISNSSFDAITFEVWGALLNGGRLVILPTEVVLSPEAFAAAIEKHQLSAMFLTSSLFNVMAGRCPHAFRTVRHLLVGGDAVDPRWARHVLQTAPLDRIINGYGPTECTTFSVTQDIREVPEGAKLVPIGRPLSNSQAYVLDWNMQPAPVGVPGELYLGGDGLAKGYWNQPELTRERFVPSPFDPSGNARLYKTGDLARYREDGVVECLGRTDHQVKIRGFRIEMGEIETVLRQHPMVRDAAVVVGEDASGAKTLWAYAATGPEAKPNWSDVRRFLRERLPEFMLPSACLFLDKMPLSPNGKVDRKKLPPLEPAVVARSGAGAAPGTEAEAAVAAVWKKVLGGNAIGLDDNFFEVGGNSLLIAEVESELRPHFGTQFTITDLFEHPTVRTLAARLTGANKERNLISSAHDRAQRQKMALSGLRTAARRA